MTIFRGEGNDDIYGGPGADFLDGGIGADYFDCGTSSDTISNLNISEGDIAMTNCEKMAK